ncbi:type VI secretion protein [Novosphingobium sp. ERN07]|uniref:type IV secretion system protein VirB3 n=1 Tax=Novosphingobium sp. ERN07 TaxID=2726187 RepID=UPI001456A109|nr:VirB3 family type IV secretion system protein [Novosphingobium sp. ERN07]NLR73392.1 type VI secretion protein [Novosphingobium sp. ERN07]
MTSTRIFTPLTRPQTFGGVTYSFFIINMAVNTEMFLMTRSYWILLSAALIHVVGYMFCLREPRVFDLWLTKVSMCPRIPNWRRWGCNSYSP